MSAEGPKLPGHVPSVAPGMSQVIVAGEKYALVDDNGQELELEGRDRPWVIEFLTAFDNYMDAAGRLGDENEHVMALAKAVREQWFQMPEDLVRKMPSSVLRGVKIDVTHPH